MKITLLAAEQGEVSFGEYNHILCPGVNERTLTNSRGVVSPSLLTKLSRYEYSCV